ncbi:filamentous hemagglutinin N-terminal domain-containing protein [Benzoatithermus flavus]|uniref:Filamentous hemagglutinin N-terminal domain-containing protein n=1 Tax=Benzoatithermus flavus TaxID=3108223 RepID=A0ABU8XSX7_9PROT
MPRSRAEEDAMARQGGYRRLVGLALGTLLWPVAGAAEVATDGTLGPRLRLAGPEVTIPARLGRIRGKNLFHSFARFGVEEGQRVTFTGPSGLRNIIGRVTGGAASVIDGTLASAVPGADLWLLNPAGILFGPDARLAVQGSFHASTADELRFADGAVFSARAPGGSVLSVAAPQAFGFLGARPAPVTVDRSVLAVPQGQALSLTGGDVTIRGEGVVSDLDPSDDFPDGLADTAGTVRARAGRITLAALGGAGAVAVASGAAVGAVSGAIVLGGAAAVVASGDGGGTIRIRGGRLELAEQALVNADNLGVTPPRGGIDIAAGEVAILDRGTQIASRSRGAGDAGNLTVRAEERLFMEGGGIAAGSFGSGAAGDIVVQARSMELRGRTGISSNARSTGPAGDVRVEADELRMVGTGARGLLPFISSEAIRGSSGNAGTVTVEVTDALALLDSARIATSTFGPGEAGTIAVTAGSLLIAGDNPRVYTGINSRNDVYGTGQGGTVTVRVAGRAEISGRGSAITTSTLSGGRAGDVHVSAGRLHLGDHGEISSSGTSGPAGNVLVTAGTLELDHARLLVEGRGANGGRIAVDAAELIDLDGSEIVSDGDRPEPGSSIIRLTAPLVTINGSRVTSLAGGRPSSGSGEVGIFGGATVISSDSFVAASSAVTVSGLESEVGSRLAAPQGVFLNAGELLRASCAARRTAAASSFTAMGRGGLPRDPAAALPGAHARAAATGRAGPVLAARFAEGCRAEPGG